MADGAFAGIRVVETAEGIGVPFASKLLADLGAEVVKVERPGTGDKLRRTGPFAGDGEGVEKSLAFLYANSSKKSVCVDVDTSEGRDILGSLVAGADVWIRQGQPELWAERGLSYEEVSKVNPDLVLASVTPFGESGPYKDCAATPFTVAHMCGNTALYPHGSGAEDKAPCLLGGNFEEYDVGAVVALGVIGALYWRLCGGEGQYLEIAEQEARTMLLQNENAPYPAFGMVFDRAGAVQKLQSSLSYRTKDGWLNPFLTQTHEFAAMAKLMGKGDWVNEPWFNDIAERRKNNGKITEAIQAWASQYTTVEAVRLLQEHRVPIGPVSTPKDVVESEQFNVRGFFTPLEHPVIGAIGYPGKAFNLSETPLAFAPAPLLGADTGSVLKETLGCSDGQIAAFAENEII